MHCPNCGTETPADAAFCQNCGASLAPPPPAQPPAPTARSKALWGAAALGLGLAVAAAAVALALFAFDDGGPKTAEATYAAAARNAVEKTKSLKQKADAAVASGDKAALKQAADEIKVEHAVLQDLTPPPQMVEFHTTVVQQVSVVYETAETIVVRDLPPEEAQVVWQEVSVQWEVWVEEAWDPWVEEVARIEEPPPQVEEPSPEPTVQEEAIADFDGEYTGEATVSVTAADGTPVIEPVTGPIAFSVSNGEIKGQYTDGSSVGGNYAGFILDPSGIAEVTVDLSEVGVAGTVSVRVAFLRSATADDVSVEGTITGSFSVEGTTFGVDGSVTANRV